MVLLPYLIILKLEVYIDRQTYVIPFSFDNYPS